MNNVQELGRLTKDCELAKTKTGISVCEFTIAVDKYRKEDGAYFFRCIAYHQRAEYLSRYGKKGKRIIVQGHLDSDSYEKNGQTFYKTQIVADNVQLIDYEAKTQEVVNEVESEELPF